MSIRGDHLSRAGRPASSRPRRAALLLAVLVPIAAGLAACDLPPGFSDEVVFDGLDLPTAVDLSPDGRVFVAEKRGTVQVFDGVGDPSPTLVADLRRNVYSTWDRGLLGMALHVELLVVGGPLEGGQAGGDGVVGARLDADVVRRVGVDQLDGLAVEQPVHVGCAGAVAAEEAVPA